MHSKTKAKLSYEQIKKITNHAFGAAVSISAITELTDGYFNSAYKINFDDGRAVVLKVAPPKDVRVMKYEHNLMVVEVSVLQSLNALPELPVPKMLYRKQGETIIENDYFFMEFIPGVPLNQHQKTLTESHARKIAADLGRIAKRVNSQSAPYFGNIARPEMQFGSWREAFLSMIKELLADAAAAQVMLPYSCAVIYEMIEAQSHVLDEVATASLVHKDLWPGNVFIDLDTAQITGIVDYERAIYGDALLEPVCGFCLENEDFMTAFWGRVALTQSEMVRTILYKIYLFLIMVIECYYREYDNDNQEKWSRAQLEASFALLTDL